MSKKPTVLMILDGYGLNDKKEGNAVYLAKTPVMDKLMAEYPFVKGNASGLAVGLPDGQMGNSEVGHMNMGAGRIVYQELTRITKEIQDGDFFKNEALLAAMKNAKENNSAVHFSHKSGIKISKAKYCKCKQDHLFLSKFRSKLIYRNIKYKRQRCHSHKVQSCHRFRKLQKTGNKKWKTCLKHGKCNPVENIRCHKLAKFSILKSSCKRSKS